MHRGGNRGQMPPPRVRSPSAALDALRERGRFGRSFLSSPRQVGAVLPTSRRTARSMLDLAPIATARCVVELGAGTGPITREILPRLGAEGRLLAFEIDPELARGLAAELPDPRLRVVADSAANLRAHLEGTRPEVIVSALPFTSLPAPMRREILTEARAALDDAGVTIVLQYSTYMERELRRVFDRVERRLSLLNVPPAVIYACRPGARG